ncbi:MAG: hypothetical protein M3Z21_15905 [Pseudomonadota bacterium]|nr:hypothetical protein [Pseudomonadota bacterium]
MGGADLKESRRWIEEGHGVVAGPAARAPQTRLVHVANREGDLRALMEEAVRRGQAADWWQSSPGRDRRADS